MPRGSRYTPTPPTITSGTYPASTHASCVPRDKPNPSVVCATEPPRTGFVSAPSSVVTGLRVGGVVASTTLLSFGFASEVPLEDFQNVARVQANKESRSWWVGV